MPRVLIAVTDSPFPSLDPARAALARVAPELRMAASPSADDIIAVAQDAASAAAASSMASSSAGELGSLASSDSLSGAFSYTGMPMSLIMLTMSSICSGSTISLGRWSLTSA